MKRWICLFFVLFVMAASSEAAPKLVAEQLNYDFGQITQGEQVEYTFRFRNAGDQLLELGNVRSSCGCTAALLSSPRIAPGDMGELQAKFDSSNFRGAISKTIVVETNDPLHPEVMFGLAGSITVELLAEPERVNWGVVEADQPLSADVVIYNRGKSAVVLQPPQLTSTELSAELSSTRIPPGGKVELRLKGKIGADKARLGGYVILSTDHPQVPQIRVPVSARLSK